MSTFAVWGKKTEVQFSIVNGQLTSNKSTPTSHNDLSNELSFCRGHFGKVSLKSGSALTPGHIQSSGVPRVLEIE